MSKISIKNFSENFQDIYLKYLNSLSESSKYIDINNKVLNVIYSKKKILMNNNNLENDDYLHKPFRDIFKLYKNYSIINTFKQLLNKDSVYNYNLQKDITTEKNILNTDNYYKYLSNANNIVKHTKNSLVNLFRKENSSKYLFDQEKVQCINYSNTNLYNKHDSNIFNKEKKCSKKLKIKQLSICLNNKVNINKKNNVETNNILNTKYNFDLVTNYKKSKFKTINYNSFYDKLNNNNSNEKNKINKDIHYNIYNKSVDDNNKKKLNNENNENNENILFYSNNFYNNKNNNNNNKLSTSKIKYSVSFNSKQLKSSKYLLIKNKSKSINNDDRYSSCSKLNTWRYSNIEKRGICSKHKTKNNQDKYLTLKLKELDNNVYNKKFSIKKNSMITNKNSKTNQSKLLKIDYLNKSKNIVLSSNNKLININHKSLNKFKNYTNLKLFNIINKTKDINSAISQDLNGYLKKQSIIFQNIKYR